MHILQQLIDGHDLTELEMGEVMGQIMSGQCNDMQIAAFLTALQAKGPTVSEITACAKSMRSQAVKIEPNVNILLDTCGTGGDKSGTFNISTTVGFVLAGVGVNVAKHGNRAASSNCGSADLLEALGININLRPEQVQKCIEQVGFGFMFAPHFHPAMKYVAKVRKALGIRTIFNILGPLTNPAGARHQVLGVFDESLTEVLAEVLKNLGTKHALVVHGQGLDEITTFGRTKISELKDGEIKTYYIEPSEFSVPLSKIDDLRGGDATVNAQITLAVLKGAKGPKRDIVLLNAAAGLIAANRVGNFKEGIMMAERSIEEGRAIEKLEELTKITNEFPLL